MQAVLEGREERVRERNNFIKRYGKSGISFLSIGVNMPGKDKNSPFAREVFQESTHYTCRCLKNEGMDIKGEKQIENFAGPICFLAIAIKSRELKKFTVNIEMTHHSGRLFDLDVYNDKGNCVSRRDLGLKPRGCFICEVEAGSCIRLQRHSSIEMANKLNQFRQIYCTRKQQKETFIELAAQAAYQAMLEEIYTTPKPGLIDLNDSGSHRDMDLSTFEASTESIRPYLSRFCQLGYETRGKNILKNLRQEGLAAEKAMFRATGGVNTHKGVIFSLGLLLAASGCFFNQTIVKEKPIIHREIIDRSEVASVTKLIAHWTQGLTNRELKSLKNECAEKLTHGQQVYLKYGAAGARGEAESGYQSVLKYALPEFRDNIKQHGDRNKAAVQTILNLLAHVKDTNVLYRSGWKTMKTIQEMATAAMVSGGIYTVSGEEKIKEIATFMKHKGVSPGGVADLLVVTLFLDRFEKYLSVKRK